MYFLRKHHDVEACGVDYRCAWRAERMGLGRRSHGRLGAQGSRGAVQGRRCRCHRTVSEQGPHTFSVPKGPHGLVMTQKMLSCRSAGASRVSIPPVSALCSTTVRSRFRRVCARDGGRAGAAEPSGREWAGRNVASRMCNPSDLRSGRLLWEVQEMTTIPRDSDIIGATALLALVLVIGLVRVFGL